MLPVEMAYAFAYSSKRLFLTRCVTSHTDLVPTHTPSTLFPFLSTPPPQHTDGRHHPHSLLLLPLAAYYWTVFNRIAHAEQRCVCFLPTTTSVPPSERERATTHDERRLHTDQFHQRDKDS